MIIFFLIILFLFSSCIEVPNYLKMTFTDLSDQKIYQIAADGKIDDKFIGYNQNSYTCTPEPLFIHKYNNKNVLINLENTGDYDIKFNQVPNADSDLSFKNIQPFIHFNNQNSQLDLKSQQSFNFELDLNCPVQNIDIDNYWTIIVFRLYPQHTKHIVIRFILICDMNFKPFTFDWSLLILIIFAGVVVYVLSQFEKIIGFQTSFKGIIINYKYVIIYMIIGGIFYLLSFLNIETSLLIVNIISIIFGTLFSYFYFNEILSLIPTKIIDLKMKIIPIYKCIYIRISDLISILLGISINFLWYEFDKPYYLNDIISIFHIGTFIKLFKIISFKNCVILFGLLIIFEPGGILYIFLYSMRGQSIDNLFLRQFNIPFQLQVPVFKQQILFKNCTWIPNTIIILPGIFLSYCYRFDKYKNNYLYSLTSFSGMMFGALFWMTTRVYTIQLPINLFVYPFQILFVLALSYKKNDLKIFWHGDFFDQLLFEPEIEQEYKLQAIVEQKEIQENLSAHNTLVEPKIFDGLVINEGSSLSCRGSAVNNRSTNNKISNSSQPLDNNKLIPSNVVVNRTTLLNRMTHVNRTTLNQIVEQNDCEQD